MPDEIKSDILKFQEKMKFLPMKAKFVEENNMHLTITFLGDVKSDDLNKIKSKLDKISGFGEFHVKLSNLKVLPSENYIRVIGIDVVDEENKMKDLIKFVGSEIGGSYHEQTKMTLCRVKSIDNKKSVKQFIDKNRNINFGDFIAKEVSLVKSTLTKTGPIYETVYKVKLNG